MSTARYSHTASDAPRFDEDDMSGLPLFLRDLETYLKDHGITSDADKIAKAPLHAKKTATRILWEELALAFKNKPWDDFVKAILEQYPEISGQQSGTLAELSQICSEFRGLGEQDGTRGNVFLRRFAPCILKLGRSNYKISNFEVCSRLAAVCTPQFLATLDMMLVGKSSSLEVPGKENANPPERPTNTSIVEGGYRWEDIVATMREVWRRGFTAAQNAIGDAYPVASIQTSAASASHAVSYSGDSESRLVKLEQDFHEFAERASQGEKETKTAIRSLQSEVHTELAQGRTKSDQNFAMIQETIQRLTNQLSLNTNSAAPQGGGFRPNYPGSFNRPQNNYGGGQRGPPRPQYTCNWCGEVGHFMNNCPDCQNAIKSGEIVPDNAGGFRTKTGEIIPRRNGPLDLPMRTKWQQMKAAVNQYVVAPFMNYIGQYTNSGMWGIPQQPPSVILDSGLDVPPGWDEFTEQLSPEQIAHYNNPPVGEMAQPPSVQEGSSQGF
uniref:CCHC-type domain-containing protein n=1 Tax=Schizophyllum commune (strain H4-8 / FGSC 9210) TaxID=578458 RepID=D8PUE4_SCHCM